MLVMISCNGYEIKHILKASFDDLRYSCCILLANVDKFKIDNKWYTFIDFDKFLELQATDKPFSSADYMAETPPWAVFGNEARGFDPAETRFRKIRNHKPKNTSDTDTENEEYAIGGCQFQYQVLFLSNCQLYNSIIQIYNFIKSKKKKKKKKKKYQNGKGTG
eukprot:TRINITY_DN75485_c0_g1_i2.p1 TRINITY_DN75485_c0_g1~~TRINITY_DN75485_c0_g1_i2.p1  ORF type:complete len:163 (-),score=1.24 TRINITY_DN75485_c0_g1_i2:6-494(-)